MNFQMGGASCSLDSLQSLGAELLLRQAEIIDSLREILPFASATLYFDPEVQELIYIAEEQSLILPLIFEGKTQANLLIMQVEHESVQKLLSSLPKICELILKNICLAKLSKLDLSNGLSNNHTFYEKINAEIAQIANTFAKVEGEHYFSSFVLIVLKIQNYKHIAKEYGYNLLEELIKLSAEKILSYLDANSLASKISENEIAIFMPADALVQAKEKCAELQALLTQISLKSPHSYKDISLELAFGYAHYPQDMDGTSYLHKNDSAWQSRVIMEKARSSAKYASHNKILAYKNILQEAGRVQNVLSEEKLICNLGSLTKCFAGQRFSLWTYNTYKGEIIITDSYDELSLADIIHWNDPLLHPQVGDQLKLVVNDYAPEAEIADHDNSAIVILNYRHMLAKLAKASQEHLNFQLALIQMPAEISHSELNPVQEIYDSLKLTNPLFLGQYSSNCLLVFYTDSEDLLTQMSALASAYQAKSSLELGIGIASYPYLHYKNTDMLDCARKALEYALLLDEQKVGEFGSLAINISADKKLSQENIFGAIEEYRHALLADSENALAWNSLGVCLAKLNKHTAALSNFLQAHKCQSDDISILYNIATTYQTLGQNEQAKIYFQKCLDCDAHNIYALLRLGQLENNPEQAKAYYRQVIDLEPSNPSPYRLLAELENDPKVARKFLHKAIQHKADDAQSLALLAKCYYQSNELSLSLSLAKQSLSFMPKNKIALELLEMIDKNAKE